MKLKTLACSASVVAMFAAPAFAQSAAPASPEPEKVALDEIVVTAQRRAQNVQDVPIAISVVSGASINQSGYKGLADIQYLAPGVQYDPGNGGGFQIRGIGTQVFDYSTEAAVSVVVDDVVYDLPRSPAINALTDIDRIEVLKGPQGTLFGKNASAGVISITTKKPKLGVFEGSMELNYGERNDRRAVATVNVPIGSVAALRISAFHTGQDGFGRYTFLGKDAGDVSDNGIRGKLLFEPSENLDVTLQADYSKHKDNYPGLGTLRTASATYQALSAAFGTVVGLNNYDNASNIESQINITNKGARLAVNYRIGDHTLTSITAYRTVKYDQEAPVNFEPTLNFLPDNHGIIDANKFSQEIRLASPSGGRLRYVLGLFYNRLEIDATQTQAGTLGTAQPPNTFLSPTNGRAIFQNRNEGKAVFGQADFDITDQLTLVLGARLTRDSNYAAAAIDPSPNLPYTFIPIRPIPVSPSRASSTNFSYRISPTFKVSESIRVYATYSTGYKGAGVAYLGFVAQPYKDETVRNIELGFKSELFDRKLRLNIAAFQQQYKDFQAQASNFVGGVPVLQIVNAGGLRTRGVDFEFDVRANSTLSFNGGMTYSEAEFTDYVSGGVQLAGQRLTNAPRFQAILGATLDQPINNNLKLLGNINASYRSSVYQRLATPASQQKGYALVNARIGVGAQGGNWQFGVYARNLFNQQFATSYLPLAGIGEERTFTNEGKRTVGAFLDAKF